MSGMALCPTDAAACRTSCDGGGHGDSSDGQFSPSSNPRCFFSRLLYAVGEEAAQAVFSSSVLVCGLGGVGSEIAKNLALVGSRRITLQDGLPLSARDLACNVLLSGESAVSADASRALACAKRLRQLNPTVTVLTRTCGIEQEPDLSYLAEYNCIILTECSKEVQLRVNKFCRSRSPPVKFFAADVVGVFCSIFCDLGDGHVVQEKGTEKPEVLIGNVSIGDSIVITAAEGRKHGFETGDVVQLDHITGLEVLNGLIGTAVALTPFKFEIHGCIPAHDIKGSYVRGGICKKVEKPVTVHFEPLEDQLWKPSIPAVHCADQDRFYSIHLGMLTFSSFQKQAFKDGESFVSSARTLAKEHNFLTDIRDGVLKCMFLTSKGQLQPLVALVGGIVAHELIKALSHRCMPLSQWFIFDAMHLVPSTNSVPGDTKDRYSSLQECVGRSLLEKLSNSNILLAGCSSVGCEIAKNLALMGAASRKGKLSIADGGVVEKWNLTSQCLFQREHVGLPKSMSATKAIQHLNPSVNAESFQHCVQPDTAVLFTDEFLKNQKVVICSLDTVEGRRYIDKRCIQNGCSFVDVGTDGCKGHVQVVVPYLTDTYSSQIDPDMEESFPYCTIKSFPYKIEHTVQWACEKFQSWFTKKPQLFNQFWKLSGSCYDVLKKLENGEVLEGMVKAIALLIKRPRCWKDCVQLARIKFEQYFHYKAVQLLHVFPTHLQDQDGLLFWRSLKRPPTPICFSLSNDLHLTFVVSMAKLLARVWGIPFTQADQSLQVICAILQDTELPQFLPKSNKKIVIDVEESKPKEVPNNQISSDDRIQCLSLLKEFLTRTNNPQVVQANHLFFNRDDKDGDHLDFVTATANLRAIMYSIPPASKARVQFIACRIVPSIVTTTSVVGALATIEVLKVIKQLGGRDAYCNSFLNLSEPCVVLSEPVAPEKTELENGVSFTLWDQYEIMGNPGMILQQFLALVKEKMGLNPSMVVYGTKMLWVSLMPGHSKRKTHTMLQLIKPKPSQKYAELTVAFEKSSGDEVIGPPIRYVFSE